MRFGMGMGMRPHGGWVALSGAALDLDFARNKAYGGTFAGLTVVRATPPLSYAETTAGTLTSFANMTLRMTDKGLLVEESRVNLALRSEEFDNVGGWTKSAVAVPSSNAAAAPDGATTADRIAEDTATAAHSFQSANLSVTSGTSYTASVYIKAETTTAFQLAYSSGGFGLNAYANFNLSTGAVGTVGSAATAGIQALSGSWYRLWMTAPATATTTANAFFAFNNNNASAARLPSYLGTSRTCLLWGGQVEAGLFVTSYIPTTTAAVTRASDIVTLATSSVTGFSATAGTLYGEGSPSYAASANTAANPVLAAFDDTTANEMIYLRRRNLGPNASAVLIDGGASLYTQSAAATWANANDSHKVIFAWQINDAIGCDNSVLMTADATVPTLPTVTRLTLGLAPSLTALNGYLKRVAYWNTRLANATLQSLTT